MTFADCLAAVRARLDTHRVDVAAGRTVSLAGLEDLVAAACAAAEALPEDARAAARDDLTRLGAELDALGAALAAQVGEPADEGGAR
ncbi:MAG: hypothetical protein KDE22_01120 [Rhodobacterales bacterium]|nr:hypothetical protein [Rhodobacterales bacterium]